MTLTSTGKIKGQGGGQKMAIISRDNAIKKYYENPPYCLQCNKRIEIPEGKKPGQIRMKKFCNCSCAAIYNNKKHYESPSKYQNKIKDLRGYNYCVCGKLKKKTSTCCKKCNLESRKIKKLIQYDYCDCGKLKRKVSRSCRECYIKIYNVKGLNQYRTRFCKCGKIKSRTSSSKLCRECYIKERDISIEKLKTSSPHWIKYRTRIAKNARQVYKRAKRLYVCEVCGYDKRIDICHKKDVKDFPNGTMLSEVNHIDNLIALCPNHHWEYDNNLLKDFEKTLRDARLGVAKIHSLGKVGATPTPATNFK
jgi:hypothetical protein